MARPIAQTPTKASESVVSRMLAKLLGVPPLETIEEVTTFYNDAGHAQYPMLDLTNKISGLYAWVTDVASDVMNDRTTPFTEFLISMPGSVYVAKDGARSGNDSLWLVVADPSADVMRAMQCMPCRGLFHTFPVDDSGDKSMVLAIQLISCRPQ